MSAPAPPATPNAPERHSPLLLVFAPIPGVGHWVVRRAARGLLAFMGFAAGLNIVVMAAVMRPVSPILSPIWGLILAGLAVLYSTVDAGRIVLRGR